MEILKPPTPNINYVKNHIIFDIHEASFLDKISYGNLEYPAENRNWKLMDKIFYGFFNISSRYPSEI